jgi:uncharacterized damage-inducible protein DinB
MYRTIEDFLQDWAREAEAMKRLLDQTTDVSLSQRVTPGGRSLGELAWHCILTLGEMSAHAGLTVQGPDEQAPVPTNISEMCEAYQGSANFVAEQIRQRWSDASLEEDVAMYGEVWKRGQVLSSLILHQAHHRGQMTVLMRQAGLQVPGIYGPSREEWAAMGMPSPW